MERQLSPFIPMLWILLIFFPDQSLAQAPDLVKKIELAQELNHRKKYAEAVSQYNEIITAEPANTKALEGRGFCYEAMGEYKLAIKDYEKILMNNMIETIYARSGILYTRLGDFPEAKKKFSYLEEKFIKKNYRYYHLYIRAMTGEHEKVWQEIQREAETGKITNNPIMFYIAGVARELSGDKTTAFNRYFRLAAHYATPYENYIRSYGEYEIDFPFINYHLRCGDYLFGEKLYRDALPYFVNVKNFTSSREDVIYKTAKCYMESSNPQKADSLFQKVLKLDSDNHQAHFGLCELRHNLNKPEEAFRFCSDAVALDSSNCRYRFLTGKVAEELGNEKEALRHYRITQKLAQGDSACVNEKIISERIKTVMGIIRQKNRESAPPKIKILEPRNRDNMLMVNRHQKEVLLKIKIEDQSEIKSVLVNSNAIPVDSTILNPEVECSLSTSLKYFSIDVTDIYDNKKSETFYYKRADKPIIKLESPSAMDQVIVPDQASPHRVYVTGELKSQINIKSISLNNEEVNFDKFDISPKFSHEVTLNPATVKRLVFVVTDKYDQTDTITYTIDYDRARRNAGNPVGRTWVYFIANWDYKDMQRLNGPKRDYVKLKQELKRYNIDTIIYKENFSKSDFESFFGEELKWQIKQAKVKSLLIWYAGHGKSDGENEGYWIPVDAGKEDRTKWYKLGYLRADLERIDVTHLLVVSDACQTGAAFARNTRDSNVEIPCSNEAFVSKSRKVMTSSNTELSDDDSRFTEFFTEILKANDDDCLSMDKVYYKLQKSMKITGQQPIYKDIDIDTRGEGTFFFIKEKD